MPEQAKLGPIMQFMLMITNILNKIIVTLGLVKFIPMLKSPQKKRETVTKIGDGGAEDMKVNLRVRILRATNLPMKDAGNKATGSKGSADCYVKVKHGTKTFITKPIMENLNPEFNVEYVFESRKDSVGAVTFELWDYDRDGDDEIGKFEVKVSQIIKDKKMEQAFSVYDRKTMMKAIKCDTTRKATKLRVQLSWDQDGADGESEWLNGILRCGYRSFSDDVDAMVKGILTSSLGGLKLPMMSLSLESFSIGNAAPFFNEMRVLPTRSPQDLQLRAQLRWVASGDFGIKVRVQTSLGVGATVEVGGLEIDFPVWIQVILNGLSGVPFFLRLEQPNLDAPVAKIQLAATADPKIRFGLAMGSLSTKLPGVEEGIDFAIRKALKTFLVLPKKITVNSIPNYKVPLSPLETDAKARLSIKVLQAEDLENKNTFGSLNPYVLLTASGGTQDKDANGKPSQVKKTKAVNSSSNEAAWNEFFEFLITDEQKEKVTVQIFDPSDSGLTKDTLVGSVDLNASEILQACESGCGWQEDWYKLINCKSGRIKLAIEYGRLEPDDGPTDVDRVAKRKAGPPPPKLFDFGNIVIQVVKATGLPSGMIQGKPSTYVAIECQTDAGVATGRTNVVENDVNPEWHEDIVLKDKIPTDKSKIVDKDIKIKLVDNEGVGTEIGLMTIKLTEVLASTPTKEITLQIKDKNGKQIGTSATLTILASFEKIPPEATMAVGADWLNGILRKAWAVLTDQIELKVQAVVGEVLHKIRYPDPLPDGKPVDPPAALKIYKDLLLEKFELGQEPPSVFEMKMLNARSDQDIQLKLALRWCASDNWAIKVNCKGNMGVPDLSLQLSGLEFWLPLWIQIRLAGVGLGADILELAALEDPVIKLQVSTRAGILPGGINTDTLLGMIRPILRNALVLPNRIKVCLASDPVTGLPLAADKVQLADPALKEAAKAKSIKVKSDLEAEKRSLEQKKVQTPDSPDIATIEARIKQLEKDAAVYNSGADLDWPKDKRTIVKDAKNPLSVVNLCKVMLKDPKDPTGKLVPCEHLAEIPMQKDADGKETNVPEEKYKDSKICTLAKQIAMNQKTKFQYMCACNPDTGMPLYESLYDFKVKRLNLDDRMRRAVGRLSVKLIEADDLRDPDAWGTVDAFCEIQLVGTGNKIKSSTVFDDTAPVWSEFYDFLICDEVNEVLKIEVFDKDLFDIDALGEVEIPVKELVNRSGWKDVWFPLQKAPGGELHLGLCYKKLEPNDGPAAAGFFVADDTAEEVEQESKYKGKLMVTIQKAENLIKLDTAWSDDKGLDPYIVVDFGQQTKKTKTKDTLNPIWNETFGFDCADGGDVVTIFLKDKETLQKDRDIGSISVKLDDLMDQPGKKWAPIDGWALRGEDRQPCKNAKGMDSKLWVVFQYVGEGEPLPAEPPPIGADGVVSRDVAAVPTGPPKATIFLKVVNGKDMPKMDFLTGKADPYVSVTIGGEGKDKTRHIEAELDPVWNEDLTFQIDEDSTKSMELTVKDYNLTKNTDIGEVIIPIKEIREGKSFKNKVFPVVDKKGTQLKGKSGKPTTITLNLEWKDAPKTA